MAAPTTATATATASSALAALLLCAAAFLAADAASGRHDPKAKAKPAAGADLLESACENITASQYKGPGLTADFCMRALYPETRATSARHPRDLALVAIDLARSAAADAGVVVGSELRAPVADDDEADWSKDTALTLRYGRIDYWTVARTARVCRAMVREYDPWVEGHKSGNLFPYTYLKCADRMMDAAFSCWNHISFDGEVKKAVWKEVTAAASLANLARAMVGQMLGIPDDDGPY
ncbi:hypothetical protein GQ55_5G179300 [Panicum hallii var. hallii]|uniref:Pectinesterase inhibitor domain-containing protein n=1 Tax=Panicum hallii var. hallii TaxID=1504633 RepID=A0A2T7DHG6_9POAL|nr:hypothetical protein GQ55_5G179300 [Panicum hallii var. hallii]